jgi:hypothetical protein
MAVGSSEIKPITRQVNTVEDLRREVNEIVVQMNRVIAEIIMRLSVGPRG